MKGRITLGIVAVLASFMLAESLTCNSCNFGLFGFCLNQGEISCSTNTSVCFTGKATFPSLTDFAGFNTQGCQEPAGCNTTSGTLLGVTYQIKIDCCSTDKCNPVTVSGAPSTRMSLTVAMATAVVASVWGSML